MDLIMLEGVPGIRRACLRELCGRDEHTVEGTDASTAIELLDRLLVARSTDDLPPGRAGDLTATERDRLLAAVYARAYGSKIEATLTCDDCSEPFDLSFEIPAVLAGLESGESDLAIESEVSGEYVLPNGCRFRLPTGKDELAILGLSHEEAARDLLGRCIVDGDRQRDGELVQKALERLAPLADVDLVAQCPECGRQQAVHFTLQHYLLAAITQERPRLCREVHRLARAYGWSLTEILSLTRTQRRTYVAQVESELQSQSEML